MGLDRNAELSTPCPTPRSMTLFNIHGYLQCDIALVGEWML